MRQRGAKTPSPSSYERNVRETSGRACSARTCVDRVRHGEPVLAHVPVRERHDVVHAVAGELLPTGPSQNRNATARNGIEMERWAD